VRAKVIYSNDFWLYYSNLEVIHGKMRKIKECRICDKGKFDNLSHLYSKPYSNDMLELSFKVVNSNVFDELDKKCFFDEGKKTGDMWFDDKKSVLYIRGQKVLINRQDKITNAHKILKYIFIDNKKNLKDDFFFSEIAEDEFKELDYKERKNNWRTYFRACQDINEKIVHQTNELVKDFLQFNTGRTGKVSINKKYL